VTNSRRGRSFGQRVRVSEDIKAFRIADQEVTEGLGGSEQVDDATSIGLIGRQTRSPAHITCLDQPKKLSSSQVGIGGRSDFLGHLADNIRVERIKAAECIQGQSSLARLGEPQPRKVAVDRTGTITHANGL